MKRITHIVFLLLLLLLVPSACRRSVMEQDMPLGEDAVPYGTPVTLTIPFGGTELYEVEVGTKAEAAGVNETHIHDLYVMIFDLEDKINEGDIVNSPRKIYGRYFSYEHKKESLSELNAESNECWYVDNKTIEGVVPAVAKTVGAVKLSTISCPHAKVVVIANVSNALTNLDGEEPLDRLNAVSHYNELKGIQVCLEQDIVNRKDLFLMTGELGDDVDGVSTASMRWNRPAPNESEYNPTYKISLTPVDAKVKFRVKVNPAFISAATPVYWQVCSAPDRCYLYDNFDGVKAPPETKYFESQQYYFEGEETEDVDTNGDGIDDTTYTYYTFCFYVLENRFAAHQHAENYYQRELREKGDSGEDGYFGPSGPDSGSFGTHYVNNGDWLFAPSYGTYVQFDLVLTLTPDGIQAIRDYEPEGMDPNDLDPEGMKITQALTSDAIFTVHLGDFGTSDKSGSYNFDQYYTERGNFYTYNVTINNTRSIYAEVMYDREVQAGQEGFLLLTDSEIINADCHYEYHQIQFTYRPDMSQKKFSWYVKTPFGEGGPVVTPHLDGTYTYDASGLDYLWVMFGVNDQVSPDYTVSEGGLDPDPVSYPDENGAPGDRICPYTKKRHAYPGDNHYDPTWKPGQTVAIGVPCDDDPVNRLRPDIMDITQLIEYIFYQTDEKRNKRANDFIDDDESDDIPPVIRVTAFINEYYYESDPTVDNAPVNPDLWRRFVNAQPRELHILADAQQSRDRKSDVILSSHSIIQQSIQTIYNIYAANLHSLWGTEHQDEMRKRTDGWPYWPKLHPTIPFTGSNHDGRAGKYDTIGKENGRLNSAYIWGFYSSQGKGGTETESTGEPGDPMGWDTYLHYHVNNNTPELKEAYHGMAYSCLTRNRDNNGNGVIDRDEVRWYLAACNQLVGMWVGNESLSIDARLYRPEERQWRAHVFSSTDWRLSWSEEGGGATDYSTEFNGQWRAWNSQDLASKGESVRCLRNIGTYTDGSGNTQEITGAPYDEQPDQYFVITPTPNNNDPAGTHYTFEFDNLNPKSLRELSESELPYHDQFNVANCVYLKFETQSREDELSMPWADGFDYPFYENLEDVNPTVTRLGYNPYCPQGYRFPNQSEQLLMSLYLPDNYRTKDGLGRTAYDYLPNGETTLTTVYKKEDIPINPKTGKQYGAVSHYRPSRTYYDRGQYGLYTAGFNYEDDPGNMGETYVKNREQGKTGWAWSDKLHNANTTDHMTRSRCVRDKDMTGTIEGGLLMKDVLYPGDEVPLSFSFYSTGSSFISASLKFCYTDGSGVYHERDIPVQSTPTGFQFLSNQTVTIPTLSTMGFALDPALLDNNEGALRKMKFKVTLRNAYVTETFEQPFTLGNPLEDISLTLKGEEGYENELYPGAVKIADIDFSSKANTCKLHSLSVDLEYTDKNGATQTVSGSALGFPSFTADSSLEYKYLDRSLSIPNLGSGSGQLNFNLADLDDNEKNSARFVITVYDKGGSSKELIVPAKLANPLMVTDAFVLTDALNSKIYPSDQNHVTVGVRSKASSINLSSVSMALCYGVSTVIPIGGIPALEGTVKTYGMTNQAITIPALASMTGLTVNSLETGEPATIRLTVTAGGYTKMFETGALTISHPIAATTYTIDSANDKIYPGDSNTVTLNFSSMGNTPRNLSTVTVQLYDGATPMGDPIVSESGINNTSFSSSGSVDIPTLGDLGLDVAALDPGTEYTLKAIITNVDDITRTIDKTLTLSNPISGSFSVPAGYVYAADNNTLNFSVSSLAKTSTLSSVSFKVTYTGIDGATHDVTSGFSIPGPSGKTYSGDKTVTFPVLTLTPETDAADTSLPVTLTATFTDDGGITREIPCNNVPIRSHVNAPVVQIPSDYSGSSPSFVFPVKAKLGDAVANYTVSAMKLQWKKNGETVWSTDTYDFYESDAAFQTVSDASTRASLSLSTGSYINYRAMSICSTDGTAVFSPVWSMWLARYNYVLSNNTSKWSFDIQNLDIPGGDFIQTSITATQGYNVETNKRSDNKFELIGFGAGDSEAVFYEYTKSAVGDKTIHVQRRDGGLQIYGWWKNKDGWRWKKYNSISGPFNILFNSNGLYYQNSNLYDPTLVANPDDNANTDDNLTLNITNLINATRMQVGSAQGVERPYSATYHFVRVVRKYEIPEP